ncbi:MAG TPA: hypothetical protein VJA45_01615 [Methylomirabilota bacterium]|nr:hypothetical protein [Methylomirabilota bacterium]
MSWIAANCMVLAALLYAALVAGAAFFPHRSHCGDSMGTPRWDPSKSWASTITVFGAVVGTVFTSSAVLLPKETTLLPKAQFSSLSLFFAALVVIAPLVYNAIRRNTATSNTQIRYEGWVWSFGLASVFTLWGIGGQLLTLFLLLHELRFQGSMPDFVAIVFQALLGSSVLLVSAYAYQSVQVAVVERNPAVAVATSRTRDWPLL